MTIQVSKEQQTALDTVIDDEFDVDCVSAFRAVISQTTTAVVQGENPVEFEGALKSVSGGAVIFQILPPLGISQNRLMASKSSTPAFMGSGLSGKWSTHGIGVFVLG